MNTERLAPIFVSHGSPMTALEPGAAGAFLAGLGERIDRSARRPRAIVAASAHTLTREPTLLAAARHPTVHDFYGFPDALYRLSYDTAGAPELAQRAAALIAAAGMPVHVVPEGGLDHGIWSPLRFAYPAADIPVLPLGFPPDWSPARLAALGRALAPLADEGVLLMGSGSITHNLRLVFGGSRPPLDAPEIAPCAEFRQWFADRGAARDWGALFDYRARAPHALLMHPTDEHLLPYFVAAGAGGEAAPALRLHASVTYGCLGMDAYAFGDAAPRLLADEQAAAPVH
jgi:4,5-DOPA dioxygenase extradiol